MSIHASAQIAAGAHIGANVRIGPFAIVEDDTTIGDGCIIDSHAMVRRHVHMGSDNEIGPFAVIGGLPQDLSFDRDSVTRVEIGSGNVFREGVTINRGSQATDKTVLGSNNYLMNNSHVGHDCRVGDHCVFASCATLGGHVQMGSRVFFGGGAMVHQFCRVGDFAIVAGVIGVRKDVLPFAMLGGQPVRHYRVNSIGLRRAGVTNERIKTVGEAYRVLKSQHTRWDTAIEQAGLRETEEILLLKNWLAANSKRGIYRFAGGRGEAD